MTQLFKRTAEKFFEDRRALKSLKNLLILILAGRPNCMFYFLQINSWEIAAAAAFILSTSVCVLKFGQHYYVGLKLFVNTCTSSLELDIALISLRKQKTIHYLLQASFFRFSWQIFVTMWFINKFYLLDITFFLWQYYLGQIIAYSQPATPNHIYLIKRAQYLHVNICYDNSWLIYSAYQVLLRQNITAAEPVWHRETRCRYMQPSSSTRYADMSPLVLPPAWWQYRRSRLIIRMITICHQC